VSNVFQGREHQFRKRQVEEEARALREENARLQYSLQQMKLETGPPVLPPSPKVYSTPKEDVQKDDQHSEETVPRGVIQWRGISETDLMEALAAAPDPKSSGAQKGSWRQQLLALGAHLASMRSLRHVEGGLALDQTAVQGALAVLRSRLDEAAAAYSGVQVSEVGNGINRITGIPDVATPALATMRRDIQNSESARAAQDVEIQALRHQVGQLTLGKSNLEAEVKDFVSRETENQKRLTETIQVASELRAELLGKWEGSMDAGDASSLREELYKARGEITKLRGEAVDERVRYEELAGQRNELHQLLELQAKEALRIGGKNEQAIIGKWKARAEEALRERDEAYRLLRAKDMLLEELDARVNSPISPPAPIEKEMNKEWEREIRRLEAVVEAEKRGRKADQAQYRDDLEALSDYVDDLEVQLKNR